MASAITLVFTDVVGSSAAKRDADLGSNVSARDHAYLEAIQAKHLKLVRSAVAEHGGTEIMTIGDAFFLTFKEPLDALRCCAAIQQRLKDQPIDTLNGPLRLRIGIHTGSPEYFEGSWHGTDVDIAARCQSVASPRQIIMTHAARQLSGEPLGIKFRPLGTFALKGVGNVRLWDADYDYHGLRRPTSRSNQEKKRLTLIGAVVIALFLLPMLSFLLWHEWHLPSSPVIATAAPGPSGPASSIIVAQFDNKTGEAVFDSVLTPALTIQLQQSPVLNIVSAEHLRQSMQYLGKSPSAPLTPEDAKEIGVREGIKAYLTGTISKLGSSYFLNVNAINTNNGDSLASAEAEAPDEEHVLSALSTVATTMRNKLGESLSSIQKLDTPLGQATTPSLEAFRAFALGDVEHDQGRDVPDAEGHYRQALEIDPSFAMAWARLGAVYNNTGQTGRAAECFTKAFQLSKTVSERERFYISSFYYTNVPGDLQKSIDTLELACRTYPLEKGFYVDLSIAQNALGRVEDALTSSRKALALSPDSAISNVNVLFGLVELDRYAEAFQDAAELKKLGLNDTSDMSNLYYLHFLTGDSDGMERDRAIVQGRNDENVMTFAVATCAEFAGKYRLADQAWRQARAQCEQQGSKDAEASAILLRDSGRVWAELPIDAVGDIRTALALDQSKGTLENVTGLAALAHHPELGSSIMSKLASAYPNDPILNYVYFRSCRAVLDLNAHQPQKALGDLEGTEPYDLVSCCEYLRGLADLDLHDGAGAIAAFKKATRYRGAAVINVAQDYGQATLGLARAYTMTGDSAAARESYQNLFTIWKNADTDLPQLVVARREYAALR